MFDLGRLNSVVIDKFLSHLKVLGHQADKRVLFLVQATARNGTGTLRFKHFYLISETWPLEDYARFPFPHSLFGVLCWPAPLLTSICIYSWLTSVY